jgi:hypothetical protein
MGRSILNVRNESIVGLSAFRSVKEDPHCEVIAEIFKSMFHSRGNKQEIVRSKLPALTRANEITGAADNNIDFIATDRE